MHYLVWMRTPVCALVHIPAESDSCRESIFYSKTRHTAERFLSSIGFTRTISRQCEFFFLPCSHTATAQRHLLSPAAVLARGSAPSEPLPPRNPDEPASRLFSTAPVLRTEVIVPGKLTKEVLVEGSGAARPATGQTVTAHYVGKLSNGTAVRKDAGLRAAGPTSRHPTTTPKTPNAHRHALGFQSRITPLLNTAVYHAPAPPCVRLFLWCCFFRQGI